MLELLCREITVFKLVVPIAVFFTFLLVKYRSKRTENEIYNFFIVPYNFFIHEIH